MSLEEIITALWPYVTTIVCVSLMKFFLERHDNTMNGHSIGNKGESLGLGLEHETEDDEEYGETDPDDETEWGSPDNDSEDDDIDLPAPVRKIVDDVISYRTRFRTLNKHIRNRIVSEELEQLDFILSRIIERVRNDPSTAPILRRLMDYYLPTTEKLLITYDEFEHQPIKGENIDAAKHEIRESLKGLNYALENMFNNMFQDEAQDVSTDASVMRTMLKQDGLLDEEIYTCDDQEGLEKEDPRILKVATPLENIDREDVYDASELCDDIFDD